MTKYFDVILQDTMDIDPTTEFYLIEANNQYYLRAVVAGSLQNMSADPLSRASSYWPVATEIVLNLSAEGAAIFFPDGELTSTELSLTQIVEYLTFNPKDAAQCSFNLQVAREARQQWVADIMQGGMGNRFFPRPNNELAHMFSQLPDDVVNVFTIEFIRQF